MFSIDAFAGMTIASVIVFLLSESTVFVKICGETGEKGDSGFISPSGLSQQRIGGAAEACVSYVRASARVKHC